MGREKSIFEQMGGTYTEKGIILYPNILIGEEETKTMQNTFSGKYGDLYDESKMKSMKYKMTVYDEFLKEYEYRKKHCGVKENIQKKRRDRER